MWVCPEWCSLSECRSLFSTHRVTSGQNRAELVLSMAWRPGTVQETPGKSRGCRMCRHFGKVLELETPSTPRRRSVSDRHHPLKYINGTPLVITRDITRTGSSRMQAETDIPIPPTEGKTLYGPRLFHVKHLTPPGYGMPHLCCLPSASTRASR